MPCDTFALSKQPADFVKLSEENATKSNICNDDRNELLDLLPLSDSSDSGDTVSHKKYLSRKRREIKPKLTRNIKEKVIGEKKTIDLAIVRSTISKEIVVNDVLIKEKVYISQLILQFNTAVLL